MDQFLAARIASPSARLTTPPAQSEATTPPTPIDSTDSPLARRASRGTSPARAQPSAPAISGMRLVMRTSPRTEAPADRTLDLRERLVTRRDLHFRNMDEAVLADKTWGEAHPNIARAALAYVLAHCEEHNTGTIVEMMSESPRLLLGLADPGWHAGDELTELSTPVSTVCGIARGVVALHGRGQVRVRHKDARGDWHTASVEDQRGAVNAVCAWRDGFVTASNNRALLVWRLSDGVWQSQSVSENCPSVEAMCEFGGGFVTVCANGDAQLWAQTVSGEWRAMAYDGSSKMTAVCAVGPSLVAGTSSQLYTLAQTADNAWHAAPLPQDQQGSVKALCALSDDRFVALGDNGLASIWQRLGESWERIGQAGSDDICAIASAGDGGFVASTFYGTMQVWHCDDFGWRSEEYPMNAQPALTLTRVFTQFIAVIESGIAHTWQSHAPGLVPGRTADALSLGQALAQGRLEAARLAWERGERPDETVFDAAVSDPDAWLAVMASWPDIEPRNGRGKTLVAAAIEQASYTAAARHLLHGATCAPEDVQCALEAGADACETIAALLARGLLEPDAIQITSGGADGEGVTLVMHVCAMGFNDLALDLVRRGFAVFPSRETRLDDTPYTRRAACSTAVALQPHDMASIVAHAPPSLGAMLLPEARTRGDLKFLGACLRATLSNSQTNVQVLHDTLVEWARNGATDALRELFDAEGSEGFYDSLRAINWEGAEYVESMASRWRDAGMHPAFLARYKVSTQPSERLSLAPSDAGEALVPWLRQRVRSNSRGADIKAHRDDLSMPPDLRDDDPDDWRGAFTVHFVGEEGQDQGGLTADWIGTQIKRSFAPDSKLFNAAEHNAALVDWHPDSHAAEAIDLRVAGRLLGKALLLGIPTGIRLPDAVLLQLVNKPVGLDALAQVEPGFAASLRAMLNDLDASDLALTFSVAEKHGGGVSEVELRPNGKQEEVTNDNKAEYVMLMTRHVLTRRVASQLEAFLTGFYELVPARLLNILSIEVLGGLISGEAVIDVGDWRNHTHVIGNGSRQLSWFWEVIEEIDEAQRFTLLRLVTGASAPPHGGFQAFTPPFEIAIVGDHNRLPAAHVCFNRLDLPCYGSKDVLKKKLLWFIDGADGSFGIA